MSTITAEQQAAIAARLQGMTLPVGLGTEESACSIAAINLALTGELSDDIPACMSEVIGRWIIPIQDAMPRGIRNSQQWKSLLPLAAGTGQEREQERLAVIMDWMWGKVLPALQPMAEEGGYGEKWLAMTTHRTEAAARAASRAADAADAASRAAGADAADAEDAADAAWAATAAAKAADAAWWTAEKAAYAAASAAERAAYAAAAAWRAADAADADTDVWTTFDPCGLLERLIRVGEQNPST